MVTFIKITNIFKRTWVFYNGTDEIWISLIICLEINGLFERIFF